MLHRLEVFIFRVRVIVQELNHFSIMQLHALALQTNTRVLVPRFRVHIDVLFSSIQFYCNCFCLYMYTRTHAHRVIKSICAPDDYSIKNEQKYFKQFQSIAMIT
jgi:hypothetical protein